MEGDVVFSSIELQGVQTHQGHRLPLLELAQLPQEAPPQVPNDMMQHGYPKKKKISFKAKKHRKKKKKD
jgi:hypothetical protein